MTLYTRGKKAITYKIADDTEAGYAGFQRSVKHIAGDRQDFADVEAKLKGSGFQVRVRTLWCAGEGWGGCGDSGAAWAAAGAAAGVLGGRAE